eukprot:TRINITY_DN1585_c0_g1_i4.p2 TRINITY_DN1585_c0_g1~~TRINITY_DN1585_c0_g1_i4.p2  ORF type:complete len:199 (-),score=105.52 TRINITY_DN1585_c0_g1_i4:48-644(-)
MRLNILFATLAVICFAASVQAATPPIFVTALTDLYNSAGGPGWTKSTNWTIGDPCINKWYGVTCDQTQKILGLTLPNNNLVGSLPDTVTGIYSIKNFDLSSNKLSGTVPYALSSLRSVENLYLNNNQFTGTLTDSFNNFLNLKNINLANNQIIGTIPKTAASLNSLVKIILSGNKFNGTVHSSFGGLDHLTNLFVVTT